MFACCYISIGVCMRCIEICITIYEHKLFYESLPGGNQVDGLPPVCNTTAEGLT